MAPQKQIGLKRLGIILLVSILVGNSGCGIFKDTKIEEIYKNIVSRYNGYFNARMLMQDLVEKNRNTYQDDFNEILSIHQFPDKQKAKNNTPTCDKIIKKCTRVLQKHGETKWSDDCYFLMGKARFYKGKLSKAIQMFRYISSKYKQRPTADKAKVWLVHSYMQQGNFTDARAMLTNIQSQGNFPEEFAYKLQLAEAAVAIHDESYNKARIRLQQAIPEVNNNELQHRYRFIAGQLSQEQGDCRKAIKTYNKVISRRTRYELAFHAKINKAACFKERADEAPKKMAKVKEDLQAMLKDDKNVDYKSRIYFELAQISRETGNRQNFLKYLDKALATREATSKQKTAAYRSLAEYHYNQNHYSKAKAYFDSTFQFISKDADGFLALKRKKAVLDELIAQKQTIRIQDSLRQMAEWPKKRFKQHFAKLIKEYESKEAEKQQRQANRKQQLERIRNRRNNRSKENPSIQQPDIGRQESSWYFYNETAKGRGLPEFKKKWGDRPLQDFWRTRTNRTASASKNEPSKDKTEQEEKADTNRQRLATKKMLKKSVIPENYKKLPAKEKQFYAQVPLNERQKRVSKNKKLKARFELGRIYYQDLKAYEKAKQTLISLNNDHPEHEFKPASLYYLFRVFEGEEKADTAAAYKKQLIKKHPESEYAKILQQSDKAQKQITKKNPELERYYQQTYQQYQNAHCDSVRQRQKQADSLFEDNYLSSKLQYISILCEGKHEDTKKTFKQKLKDFMNKYKGSKIASHARNVYNYLQKDGQVGGSREDRFPFEEQYAKKHFYFMVLNLNKHKSKKVVQNLSDYNDKYYEFLDLNLSTSMFGREKQFVIVKDFEDKDQSMRYLESLANDKEFLKSINMEAPNHFVATKANFRKVAKEDALRTYEQFFKKNYLENTP